MDASRTDQIETQIPQLIGATHWIRRAMLDVRCDSDRLGATLVFGVKGRPANMIWMAGARNAIGLTTAVLWTALLSAAPPPDAANSAHSPDSPIHDIAREYSFQLFQVVAQVEQNYVRPVARAELVAVALAGLYEAARQPAPSNLKADIQRAAGDLELQALITRCREGLGDLDSLRGPRALLASVAALPRALDPFCSVTGPKEFQLLDLDTGVPGTGLDFPLASAPPSLVGMAPDDPRLRAESLRASRFSLPAGPVRVIGVQPGSPAQKTGIRPGDLVVAVDGKAPEHPTFAQAFMRLMPPRTGVALDFATLNAPIKLRLLRAGRHEPMEVTLTPAPFRPESVFGVRRKPDNSWDYLLDAQQRIGYIRIGLIQRHTPGEFAKALDSLRAPELRGLLLDLRWCPGGLLSSSATVARQLLAPDQIPIATQRDRAGRVTPVEFNPVEKDATDFPILVLVNGATSGGGELVAAALQDHGRAVIAGQRTVGKSSVQEPKLENFGIPLKITTSMLIRPGHRGPSRNDPAGTENWAVKPDAGREIPGSTELSRQLKSWWTEFALRPADSADALPLDDPENDPQRQSAVQMLRALIAK